MGFYTFLSRVLGLVRDIVVARYFGAGMAADAFFVAFRIPNLLRRLFAEGSLTIAFIPVFTEYLAKKSKEDAFEDLEVLSKKAKEQKLSPEEQEKLEKLSTRKKK